MVAVISSIGVKLMPTTEKRARLLLKRKKAVIFKYKPLFTIQLTERKYGDVQDIEYKCDTGYQHIGISVCSQKHEYVHRQYDLLLDEVERHNDSKKHRRTRRNRLRYRKCRFKNRKKPDGWFAPSLRNKRDVHVALFKEFSEIMPIASACFEMGQFDTQVLKAIEEGKPLPQGTDYQHGERYKTETLREAVFTRDGHKCVVCGNHGILHAHHIGFWKQDRTNRMSNLMTVCHKCHTAKNHSPGGLLYGLNPRLKDFKGATFMSTIRYSMLDKLKDLNIPVHVTYGSMTKTKRYYRNISKTHANDAYVMGALIPKHRCRQQTFQKLRRNNRILEKFYDAKYVDIRNDTVKPGKELSCGRTNRKFNRNNPENQRIFRGKKVSNGRRSIRKQRYTYRPKDIVFFNGNICTVIGTQNKGKSVMLAYRNGTRKSVSPTKLRLIKHVGGWCEIIS